MIPFTLHLMRHGPPLRTGLMLGHHDEPAASGAHADMVSRAAMLEFGAIVSSDLGRAVDGAAAIARAHGLPLRRDVRWRELHFGVWDGMPTSEIDPQGLQRFWADPDAYPPPGGERWSALRRRVLSAIDALAGPALVVTHGGAMRAAISVLTGLDHRGVWAFDMPYGACVSLRVWRGETADTPLSGQITDLRS